MSLFETFFIVVFIVNICLGIGVYLTNRKRTLNQHYLTASILIALWLSTNWMILQAHSASSTEVLIKVATAIAVSLPASSNMLRLSIVFPSDNWLQTIFRARYVLLACIGIGLTCFSPFFIKSVKMPIQGLGSLGVPEPIYGWSYFVFALFFISLVASLPFLFISDRKKVTGLQKIELDFITMGYFAALAMASFCGIAVTLFTSSSQTVPMANATSILAFTSIISYGIAMKRILDIATIARRFMAYGFLTFYLILLYLTVWHSASFVAERLQLNISWIPQILAALTAAFSMAPALGKLQKLSNKLISSAAMDIPSSMKHAGNIFQTVTTKDDLLSHFRRLLIDSLGTDKACIFSKNSNKFVPCVMDDNPIWQPSIAKNGSLAKIISNTKEPVSLDSLIRSHKTTQMNAAVQELEQQGAKLAIGIFSKSNLSGIVIFGDRLNGRIYDNAEQEALQILCNQFAVALENAQLYTQMQDSKIRNEIMLDQLISGVIVADPNREITLFNHEAQTITGINDQAAIGQNIAVLPREIYLALESTLDNKNGVRNIDASLSPRKEDEETSKNIRMGSAFLFGHNGKPMGALLVFTDVTELKGLEEQVRRSDQLSSVGTLAAGMAHEIKNPLVTIKTFAQLLPKRYADDDFRNDFSTLVAHEVSRIDGIVNELLSFSKPAKPHLIPIDIQNTIDQTLKLIHEQLSQKNITLKNNCHAQKSEIFGDAKLLSQALINLTLNATEAIGKDGCITIGTTNCSHRFVNIHRPEKVTVRQCIRIQISDTGKGIDHENLAKIFDPFFTNKSEGTGMGLSVAHGIITEHHGLIEVESEVNRGTTFYVYIPILEEGTIA